MADDIRLPQPPATPGHPAADDVLGSAETLLVRFADQLTCQLAGLRPFPATRPGTAGP